MFKHPIFYGERKGWHLRHSQSSGGTYTVEAWHEKLGTAIQKITIGANETKAVDFVFSDVAR